jgi:hypothetical protein
LVFEIFAAGEEFDSGSTGRAISRPWTNRD